jgi:hypothetical protein
MRDITSFNVTCAECGFKAYWIPNGLSLGTLHDNPDDYSLCRFVTTGRHALTPMTCRHFREALIKATAIAFPRQDEP